ncbi:MAG: hypothetical protein QM541_07995 [Flavobacterium sp.]|nr:hypothetical protein [Flavobacterium sp.]
MKQPVTKKALIGAETKMKGLQEVGTKKGSIDKLTPKKSKVLNQNTLIANTYDDTHYTIELPQTVQGLIKLKMYEMELKQTELAILLNITDKTLSEIMHSKRKISVQFLKALHQVLRIDGNLLLKIA